MKHVLPFEKPVSGTSWFAGQNRSRAFVSAAFAQGKTNGKEWLQRFSSGKKGILTILITLLLSVTAMASHYKGGQITYQDLGGGKYKILVKSYWKSSLPGSVVPAYSGSPILNTMLTTVSLNPLPDGVTVEKVEQQTVTWPQPGLYTISWTNCCRVSGGANFGANDMGLFAAVKYDPAHPSSSPQFYDLPVFNFASNVPVNLNFNNTDPDGQDQEYDLNIPYGTTGNPYTSMLASGFQVNNNGTVTWPTPQLGVWLVNVKMSEKINGVLTGAYVYRDFMLNIFATTNKAPLLTTVNSQTVIEGQTLQFNINATDPNNNTVKLQATGLPLNQGGTFVQNSTGSAPSGTFTWTPAVGATGTYTLQFVATDNASVPLSTQMSVQVTVSPATCKIAATATVTNRPCQNAGNTGSISIAAAGSTASYLYSIDGGQTLQSSNVFTGLAPGTYQTYVQNGNCTSDVENITIAANPLPVVSLPQYNAVCINGSAITLSGGQPAGGVYSGDGVNNGIFDPAIAGVGTHTISYEFTNSSGCSNTAVAVITVNAMPTVTLSNLGTVCIGSPAFLLDQGLPYNGVYSGDGVVNGMFNPAVAGVGQHTITYTFSDNNSCINTASADIIVEALPQVSLGSFAAVCADASSFTLSGGSPANGTYSGPGVVNGIFNPATAGAGLHQIDYTYTTAAGCTNIASATIQVSALPQVTLAGFNSVCAGSASIGLSGGLPLGGTYSGNGVSNGIFDPATAGVGTHTITYAYANAAGCNATATNTITINSILMASAGADASVIKGYNATDACTTLAASAAGGANGYTYLWNTGATTASIKVCPTATTTYTVTVKDAAGCTAQDQVIVNVNNVACGNKGDKVTVCHNGNELCISANAVQAHLNHGDYLGACNADNSKNKVSSGVIISATPNPFNVRTQLNFTLEETSSYTLELFDMKGALVKHISTGVAKKGQLNSIDILTSECREGVYFARLVTGKAVTNFRLLLLK